MTEKKLEKAKIIFSEAKEMLKEPVANLTSKKISN